MTNLILANSLEVCMIDDDNYTRLSKYKWFLESRRVIRRVYFAASHWSIPISHDVIGIYDKIIDHINVNFLDNRRDNLRVATWLENSRNKRKYKTNNKYKGVCFHKRKNKFQAYIRYNTKLITLGYFIDEIVAAKTYDTAAKQLFGKFALLNFNE